jgi:hypothetical protein
MASPRNYNNVYPIKYLGNRVQTSVATCTSYLQDYDGNIVSIADILATTYVSNWAEFLTKIQEIVDNGNGGVINLAPVILEANSTAIIPSNVKIFGSGKGVTIIRAQPGIVNIFDMDSASDILIQNITFDANSVVGVEMINAPDTTNIAYDNCEFINVNNGLFLLQSGDRATITNCDFATGTGSSAISITGTNHRVIQSSFDTLSEISMTNVDKILFNSNYINTVSNIAVSNSNNVLLTNNIIESFEDIIEFTNITDFTFSDNIIKGTNPLFGIINLSGIVNGFVMNNLFDFAVNSMITTDDACNTLLIKNNQFTGTQVSEVNSFFNIDTDGTNIVVLNNNCKRDIPLTATASINRVYDSQLNIVVTAGATINITLNPLSEGSVGHTVYLTNDTTSNQSIDVQSLYDPIGSYTHTVVAATETCVVMWTGFRWRLIDPGDSTPA